MKKRGQAASFLVMAAVVLCVLGGCSKGQSENIVMETGGKAETEDGLALTFMGYKADALNLVAIEAALRGFMDENPYITVNYEGIKGTAYWEAFEKRADSGNLTDIIMVDRDHMLALRDEDRLMDLSDLATIENFAPLAYSQIVAEDGGIYFLPTCISTYNLYINHDLLKEHGQKIPTNYSEFAAVCDYFAARGVTPVIANNYGSLKSLVIAKGMYPVYQKENYREEIEAFNSGEKDITETLRPGVELVETMIERGWFDCEEVLSTNQTSDDLALFVQGERPFMITGGWASPRVAAQEPAFTYGVYPYPVLEDGSVLVMEVNTCVSVCKDGDNPEAGKKLTEYMTQKDVMWQYCDSQSSYTPLKDERMPSDETIAPSAPYLTNGRSVLGVDYNLDLPLDSALRECVGQMLAGMDSDAALELLSERLR